MYYYPNPNPNPSEHQRYDFQLNPVRQAGAIYNANMALFVRDHQDFLTSLTSALHCVISIVSQSHNCC